MFDLHGRVAVVVGASAGLGRSDAIALARQGADVAIMARRLDKLEAVAEEIRSFGVQCLPIQCDVTEPRQIVAAKNAVMEKFGRVDILVNNTGGGPSAPIEEMSDETFKFHVDLELMATFRCTREFGEIMLKQGYGRVINIASILGYAGFGDMKTIAYSACKGGVINFTRGVANEWAQRGVTVNAVCPGFFPSESVSPEKIERILPIIKKNTPMGRLGKACVDPKEGSELDSTIIYLAADESSYVTGAVICCDGGWTSH